MRALVQRVSNASVRESAGEPLGSISAGLLVFVGVTHSDDDATARRMADKLWTLRIFADDRAPMNRSLADRDRDAASAAVLVVSQFTLYGDTRRGRRPSFVEAARPDVAKPIIDGLVDRLRSLGAEVGTGRFGADMEVGLCNDGPVTLMIEL